VSTRCFVALPLNDPVKETLVAAQQALRDKLPGEAVIRWSKPKQFHLTLEFLGSIEDNEIEAAKDRIRTASQHVAPFSLTLAALGSFGRPPRVIWAGVGGEIRRLQQLQQHVASAPQDSFRPHLTLGRIKRPPEPRELRQVLEQVELLSQSWTVREIILYQSTLSREGARYTPLLTRPLAPGQK
jgi:2'-5' RNA ligase